MFETGEGARSVVVPLSSGDPALLTPIAGGVVHCAQGQAMGTDWRLRVVLTDPERIVAARETMARALDRVIAEMSQWEPDSEISRFNRLGAGERMVVSRGFAQVMDCALTIARISDGAFDPTLGAVSDAWGFGPSASPLRAPERVSPGPGWQELALDASTRTLLQPGDLMLDLSGIAKGFAVDLASMVLTAAGFAHHLVEIGGEMRASGVRPDHQPWWVDVEPAPDALHEASRIALTGWSIATSGDWHRRRGGNGAREWSHTLSPAACAPVADGPRAATVLHPGCMQADALATVLMVKGVEDGIVFADTHGIAAHMTGPDGTGHASAAWRKML